MKMTERIVTKALINEDELNRDPVSGAPGSHPLGTGTGAASGGIVGAIVGMTAAGPVGSVIGAAMGAVAGGLAGKGAAEVVNPTAEEVYWRDTYVREPYYMSGKPYEYYAPGFRAGWEGRMRYHGSTFDEAEPQLKAEYNRNKLDLEPPWEDVREAARAAWNRVDGSWHVKP
jgi:hypothetical protein